MHRTTKRSFLLVTIVGLLIAGVGFVTVMGRAQESAANRRATMSFNEASIS